MKTVRDIDIANKTVILRADYNVPLHDGEIADDYRIKQSLPTLHYLLERAESVVIISHLGRPDGERNMEYSLQPVAKHLEGLLGESVAFASQIDEVDSGEYKLTLLENLRFWPGEESNSDDLGQQLATLGDVLVQDGFGVVHRAHASTEAITHHLPSVAGLLLEKEINHITQAMENPKRPLVAIFGGAKISDKIQVIEQFVERADSILIGGAMANTFLNYQGYDVGKSNYESGQEKVIEDLLHKIIHKEDSKDSACSVCDDLRAEGELLGTQHTIELPKDVAVAKDVDETERRTVVYPEEVKSDEYILDIGPETIKQFQSIIEKAGTVIWNGPLGLTELPAFAEGSNHIAGTLKEKQETITSIIGGGDTAGFIVQWDLNDGDSFTHVSTGGGAALDLMAGKDLPGVSALDT